MFTHAGAWALLLTGRLVAWQDGGDARGFAGLRQRLAQSGTPAIRQLLGHAMRILAARFVAGRTSGEAIAQSRQPASTGYCHSFDMPGEAAMTGAAARAYFDACGFKQEGAQLAKRRSDHGSNKHNREYPLNFRMDVCTGKRCAMGIPKDLRGPSPSEITELRTARGHRRRLQSKLLGLLMGREQSAAVDCQ